MTLLSLLCVGFWLIVLILHFEIRKREIEEQNLARRIRHDEARARFAVFRDELDEEERLEAAAIVDADLPESGAESSATASPTETTDATPSPAQVAAMVAPRPPAAPDESPLPAAEEEVLCVIDEEEAAPKLKATPIGPRLDEIDSSAPSIVDEVQAISEQDPNTARAVIRRFLEQDPPNQGLFGFGPP